MTEAAFGDVNAFQAEAAGSNIHVALVDSVLRPLESMDITTDLPENYVASSDQDTTGHGSKVVGMIQPFAPDSTYKLFRVIAEDGTFRPSNFLKAMEDIRSSNNDVVNVSAGKFHENCASRCRISEAVDTVVRDGSIVVTGAGNRTSERQLGVFCPGKSTESIAVGMSETLCTATPQDTSTPMGAQQPRPPGAYWANSGSEFPFYPEDAYCSYKRCSPFHECDDNRKTVYWDGNVDWHDYVPEVVAPGHKPIFDRESDLFELEPGTSYSTAVVSGCIATVLSEVFPDVPSPHRVKRAVETSSRDVDCGVVGKLDMKSLYNALS